MLLNLLFQELTADTNIGVVADLVEVLAHLDSALSQQRAQRGYLRDGALVVLEEALVIPLDLRLCVELNGKAIQEVLLCQHELQPIVLVSVVGGSKAQRADVREQAAPSPQAVLLNHSPELRQLVRLLRLRS